MYNIISIRPDRKGFAIQNSIIPSLRRIELAIKPDHSNLIRDWKEEDEIIIESIRPVESDIEYNVVIKNRNNTIHVKKLY